MISASQLSADLSKAAVFGSALKEGATLLPGFIQSAESLLPAKGQGAQKLQIVANFVQAALAWEGHAAEVIAAVWPKLEPVVATLVSVYTGNGVFSALLGATVPAPAQAPAA